MEEAQEEQKKEHLPDHASSPGEPVPLSKTSTSRAALTVVTQMAYRDGVRDAITILSLGIVTGLLAHKLWKIEL